jgi:hypothetical protein
MIITQFDEITTEFLKVLTSAGKVFSPALSVILQLLLVSIHSEEHYYRPADPTAPNHH